jgi:hypothetical protein
MFRSVTIAAAVVTAVVTLAGPPASADGYERWHRGGWGHEHREHWRAYPAPVYIAPPPVVYMPAPVYVPPPVYAPAPVYVAPPPVFYAPPALGVGVSLPGVSVGLSVPLH